MSGKTQKEIQFYPSRLKSIPLSQGKLLIQCVMFVLVSRYVCEGAFHPLTVTFQRSKTTHTLGRSFANPSVFYPFRRQPVINRQQSYSSSSLNQKSVLLNGTNNNNNNRDTETILKIAEKAAMEAGEIMKQTSGKISISKTKANAADLVTESDIECQRVIKAIVKEAFPNDIFLGEEDVETGSVESSTSLDNALKAMKESDELLWVVDPIDGTTNFQAGLPMFCCSIGVISMSSESDKPEVIVGVIYNPILDEMTSAIRGKGCYLNGDLLQSRISENDGNGIKLREALVNVGFPVYSKATLDVSSKAVYSLATKVRGLRMIASASQVMCWIAQGKFNAYISWDLNAWDIAAGMLIIEESGGFLSNFDGTKAGITSRDIIMTCNEGNDKHELSEELRLILRDDGCLEY